MSPHRCTVPGTSSFTLISSGKETAWLLPALLSQRGWASEDLSSACRLCSLLRKPSSSPNTYLILKERWPLTSFFSWPCLRQGRLCDAADRRHSKGRAEVEPQLPGGILGRSPWPSSLAHELRYPGGDCSSDIWALKQPPSPPLRLLAVPRFEPSVLQRPGFTLLSSQPLTL